MTDKVQKIREEVVKLKSNLMYGACSSQIAMETTCKEEAYNEVLAILDTMQEEQEEPAIDELEKVVEEIVDPTVLNAYGVKEIANRLRKTMIEPVSEDLEEAAKQYEEDAIFYASRNISEFFKAGAQWQKEQMMAKAVDGEVTYGKSLAIPSLGWVLDKEGLDFGDKVKLVIIKED